MSDDDDDDNSALPQIKAAIELSIFCRGCRHRLVHANSLRFLERDTGKKKPKLDLIIPHTALKVTQMLKVKDKVVYCIKCGSQIGKSGAPKGVPCRSIGFVDAGRVYAVLGKIEIREDKWAGKAYRMMSNNVAPLTVEQLASSSKSQSVAGVSTIPKYVPVNAQSTRQAPSESKVGTLELQNTNSLLPESHSSTSSVPVMESSQEFDTSTALPVAASASTSMPPPPKRLKPDVPVF